MISQFPRILNAACLLRTLKFCDPETVCRVSRIDRATKQLVDEHIESLPRPLHRITVSKLELLIDSETHKISITCEDDFYGLRCLDIEEQDVQSNPLMQFLQTIFYSGYTDEREYLMWSIDGQVSIVFEDDWIKQLANHRYRDVETCFTFEEDINEELVRQLISFLKPTKIEHTIGDWVDSDFSYTMDFDAERSHTAAAYWEEFLHFERDCINAATDKVAVQSHYLLHAMTRPNLKRLRLKISDSTSSSGIQIAQFLLQEWPRCASPIWVVDIAMYLNDNLRSDDWLQLAKPNWLVEPCRERESATVVNHTRLPLCLLVSYRAFFIKFETHVVTKH